MISMLPIAALDGNLNSATAEAAPPPPERVGPVSPPPPPARVSRPPNAADRVIWRDSVASGGPNAGRLLRGVQLPPKGEGFYTYNPSTQSPPGGVDRRWGHATVVREIILLGRWWARTHPDQPRLGIGDVSRPEGGRFSGPGVGHLSHQNGLDVDIRLVRSDDKEDGADPGTYNSSLTQDVVNRLVQRGASLVLIGPNLDLSGPSGIVRRWPNHDDHLHVRFPDPDGLGN